ncbi:hypothetical protein H072_9735 [Dactylellina haptotyla CBS 200.50]|uniref:Uncharacterized protein n=1 Tax=Dactylellina haptotyla (strain CBS 200.50) TaxID=1284197 RepID=S8BC14_DACHA|nr:hypothetical protein H072_9735 [Dactylellina haptotyla CBS 200.50]
METLNLDLAKKASLYAIKWDRGVFKDDWDIFICLEEFKGTMLIPTGTVGSVWEANVMVVNNVNLGASTLSLEYTETHLSEIKPEDINKVKNVATFIAIPSHTEKFASLLAKIQRNKRGDRRQWVVNVIKALEDRKIVEKGTSYNVPPS